MTGSVRGGLGGRLHDLGFGFLLVRFDAERMVMMMMMKKKKIEGKNRVAFGSLRN